ncbi:MAG: ABC transporter substrate-binding protein [Candidatus Heimdallarchaeota archaeon]|nr:ABC transporter substrate-binding protein [Candidatus Heimdallarchaeota archaeon]
MGTKRGRQLTLSLVLLLILSLVITSSFQPVQPQVEEEQVFTFSGCCGEFVALSFFHYNSLRSVFSAISGSLYTFYFPDSDEMIPMLADGPPTISEDKLTYIVKLKKGLQFSNGNPLDADDIVFSYNAFQTEEINQSPNYYTHSFMTHYLTSNSSITKLDSLTVQFTFAQLDPTTHEVLTIPIIEHDRYVDTYNSCVQGEASDCGWGEVDGDYLHSAGPYMVDFIYPGSTGLELVKNPYYHDQTMWADRIVVTVSPDEDSFINSVEQGVLDIPVGGSPINPNHLEAYPDYTLTILDSVTNEDMFLNFKHPMFGTGAGVPNTPSANSTNDQVQAKLVRQAISYVVNRNNAAEIYEDHSFIALPASTYIHNYVPGLKDLEYHPFAISKAREFMEQAGFNYSNITDSNADGDYGDQGDTTFFNITLSPGINYPTRSAVGLQVANDLPKIGIGVTFDNDSYSWELLGSTYYRHYTPLGATLPPLFDEGGYDIAIFGWFHESPRYNFGARITSEGLCTSETVDQCSNIVNYDNPVIEDLIDQHDSELDFDIRANLAAQIQQLVYDDLPIVPIVSLPGYVFHKSTIRGFDPVMFNLKHIDWRYLYKDGWTQSSPSTKGDDPPDVSIPLVVGIVAVIAVSTFLLRRRT